MMKTYASTQKNPLLFREFYRDASDICIKLEDRGNCHSFIFIGIKHIHEAML